MSHTKHVQKTVKTASDAALMQMESELSDYLRACRNPMVRSSLRSRLDIVRGEQQRRDMAWEGIPCN